MSDLTTTVPGKKGGSLGLQPGLQALQQYARPYAQRALDKAFELLDNSDNDSVKLGAAKLILAKVMPDLRSTEVTGEIALQLLNVIRTPMKQPLEPIKDGEIVKETP